MYEITYGSIKRIKRDLKKELIKDLKEFIREIDDIYTSDGRAWPFKRGQYHSGYIDALKAVIIRYKNV